MSANFSISSLSGCTCVHCLKKHVINAFCYNYVSYYANCVHESLKCDVTMGKNLDKIPYLSPIIFTNTAVMQQVRGRPLRYVQLPLFWPT